MQNQIAQNQREFEITTAYLTLAFRLEALDLSREANAARKLAGSVDLRKMFAKAAAIFGGDPPPYA